MQDELDELVTSHRAELRKQWNLESDGGDKADKQELKKKEFEDAEDVLARLSEDLKKVGLEDKPGL